MKIWIIFKKELKDILRDRRTIMMMIIFPLLIAPAIITGVSKVQMMQMKKAQEKKLKLHFIGKEYAPNLFQEFVSSERVVMIPRIQKDSIQHYIQEEFIDAVIEVSSHYSLALGQNRKASIKLYYKGSDSMGITRKRVEQIVERRERIIISERMEKLNLDLDIVDAFEVERIDVSSSQEKIGKAAGGFLPYIFIIFGFMGAMYPGLDLGAGEKERGTLETILSSPASRFDIVMGKFLVVLTAAITTSFIAIGGLYLAVQQFPDIPVEILQVIQDVLSLKVFLMIVGLVVPVSAFFSAIILSLSIYAKSFKEAQSIVAPLNIIIIFPAIIGTIPGIELNHITALIPVLNVSLAAKDVVAGIVDPILMAEVYGSLFLLAGLSIWFCVNRFNREETIFRN
ncbi:MAG: ABC transporter permease [Candidatus Marinimicrobia bacterium]|jgi:sodium transport system permease protein|nr:ABC transporter permease [Candidatus Neomarinimicrobiota bacterium]MBT3938006.1 ABC transporter permease [Candidatus Neomarinimicrobiota bacterium]MBT3961582.1 ABC transporter permease [Candidatus Neomarinimicrobiota bacterium]MBT4382030.1 ABC transporter permease [Candidatus Neomarinimicrobiota bacterium]MBT4636115.1 ABC transporter permease [Candidatus Neomarinimicrobiota bacterium]